MDHHIASVYLDDVSKSYGSTLAVEAISLTIQRGEFFSILGPSGSGKTTTLRLIAGLEQPDHGDIWVEGRSMRGLPPHQRPVNTVFQQYALFPHLTVWHNVAFGLEMQGFAQRDIAQRVGAMLDMVRLPDKSDRLPHALSGGEQQRVALARALVNRPSVLLLDEPLGALDQQLRQEMQRELKSIQAQVGITFVCVTHHQEEALLMSDRVAVMADGRIMQIGLPQELYEAPRSPFVAQFMGQSNRLEGQLLSRNGTDGVFQAAGGHLLHVSNPFQLEPKAPAVLIIRPEHLTLTRHPATPDMDNCLPVEIMQHMYGGEHDYYEIAVTPQVSWTVAVSASDREEPRLGQGEQVFVQWRARDAWMFSP